MTRRKRTIIFIALLSAAVIGLVTVDYYGRSILVDRFGARGSRKIVLPPDTYRFADIPYGEHPRQKLDVYTPFTIQEVNDEKLPIVMMVHGGGWHGGDKALRDVVQNKIHYFLPRGYLFVSINYRLTPEVNPAEQAGDVGRALSFIQKHAATWGGDAKRIVLMGHSAGAHLVTMLTSDVAIAEEANVQPWLGTIALDSAAYNVVELMHSRHRRVYDRAFGRDPLFWEFASPALQLQSTPAPMLLVCSTLWSHSCQQAEAYAGIIESLGGHVAVHQVVLRHTMVNRMVGAPGSITEAIQQFLLSIDRRHNEHDVS